MLKHFFFRCHFAPGTWICSGSYGPGCSAWDQEWVIEDFSGDGSGSMLSITYKYLPDCKCSCPDVGIMCDGIPCHAWDCVWIATCLNGLLSGTRYLGDARNCGTMSGLVNEHSILFQFATNLLLNLCKAQFQ